MPDGVVYIPPMTDKNVSTSTQAVNPEKIAADLMAMFDRAAKANQSAQAPGTGGEPKVADQKTSGDGRSNVK